jgi:hypothetical protein
MTNPVTEADCLALVERSPAAVAAHDKSAWLALFARNNVVEDPVGSAPHVTAPVRGQAPRDRLSRFYDTFIAPNTIRFHVARDCCRGLQVMRDLTIEIAMSERVVVHVPVHLLYELVVEEGVLKIRRLAAHWELGPMLKQQAASGWSFLGVGCASAGRMLRHLGVAGTAGFMRALSGVGEEGKARAARFARAFSAGAASDLAALFASPDALTVFSSEGPPLSIGELASCGGSMRLSKILAAGSAVTATVDFEVDGQRRKGVALFELDRGSLCIAALTFYWSGT